MDISIVIPAYNEEESILRVIGSVKEVMDKTKFSYEIIVVDDGSKDRTAERVSQNKNAELIKHPYNKGYGASLKTGAIYAKSNYILYIDADGQHDANDIPRLLRYIGRFDMIVGARRSKTMHLSHKKYGKKILWLIAYFLTGKKVPDLNSGFRLIKREIVMKFMHILPNAFSFTTTITLCCIKNAYNVVYIPIRIIPRKTGKSSIKSLRDGFKFTLIIIRIIMLFSPLRIFMPISLFVLIPGMLHLFYVGIIFRNITDKAILCVISGILLFCFGLLSDQLAQIRRMPK